MKIIKTTIIAALVCTILPLASCGGRVGEDVYDGDEYAEDYTDGIQADEEFYDNPADMLDMSPDSANIMP